MVMPARTMLRAISQVIQSAAAAAGSRRPLPVTSARWSRNASMRSAATSMPTATSRRVVTDRLCSSNGRASGIRPPARSRSRRLALTVQATSSTRTVRAVDEPSHEEEDRMNAVVREDRKYDVVGVAVAVVEGEENCLAGPIAIGPVHQVRGGEHVEVAHQET